MTDANKALAHRWFDEVWNKGNESAIDEMFPPHGTAQGLPDPEPVLTGPVGFKRVFHFFHDNFSGIHMRLDRLAAEGDMVAIGWTATMTHTGDGLGFPATGHTVVFEGCSFLRAEDGKLLEGWNHMDFTRVVQDLKELQLKQAQPAA